MKSFTSSALVAWSTLLTAATAAPHMNRVHREQQLDDRLASSDATPSSSAFPSLRMPLAASQTSSFTPPFQDQPAPFMNITGLGNGTFIVAMSNGTTTTMLLNATTATPTGRASGSTRSTTITLEPVSSVGSLPARAVRTSPTITPPTETMANTSIPAVASATDAAAPQESGRVKFGGINIAGFDFHCKTNGTCRLDEVMDVMSNGTAMRQMEHFIQDDGLNTFRLPVSWQYLVNDQLNGPLDEENFAVYDRLVQGCLSTGAELCIIDLHNYARWNGGIIGQGGASNEQFTSLWSQIAERYANVSNVAFDIMNEPHDLDISTWAETVQKTVSAIRDAGAREQMILLPGTDYASAKTFVSSGSAQALSLVKNPDGTFHNLVYNVHAYLDEDRSGTHAECVTNNIDEAFAPLAQYLRENRRMAMLTETGGGPNEESCMRYLCEQMDFLNQNSDVFVGVVTWAAGGFPADYTITETPIVDGDRLFDVPLVSQCVANKLGRLSGQVSSSVI